MAKKPKRKLSVLKRQRQNEKRRLRNRAWKTRIKNLFKKLVKEKDKEKVGVLLREFYSVVDKAVQKGIIHENTGARKKAKASRVVASLLS